MSGWFGEGWFSGVLSEAWGKVGRWCVYVSRDLSFLLMGMEGGAQWELQLELEVFGKVVLGTWISRIAL